ncbi:hypothetical protein PaG_02643 [Moesziomyces aphidis]|uniref:Uncharacterized protein n=1 Tax=Moesziomyces aphidis TaxID=84754 RepID=W3VML1_MOEAP|nr:hypothetical protein PaG_02643 [Moesziomyces aphidis]
MESQAPCSFRASPALAAFGCWMSESESVCGWNGRGSQWPLPLSVLRPQLGSSQRRVNSAIRADPARQELLIAYAIFPRVSIHQAPPYDVPQSKMAATRKQKQAQKLQEQQMSKALAEAKPSTKHFTFDDDEELDADASAVASGSTEAVTDVGVQDAPSEEDEEEEGDDEPIEVVSTKASRKQASQESAKQKAQAKVEKAKRQAAEQKRAEKAQKKDAAKAQQAEPAAADGEQNVEPEAVEEEQSHSDEEGAGTSSRLDPSLFAEVFAKPVSAPKSILKKRSAEEAADEVARLQRERKQKRKLQRAGGVVRGNDGLPMKRTQDGTVLRALSSTGSSNHKTTFDDDEDEPEEPLDVIVRPERLDRTTSLPNAKARAFRKRSMAKRSSASKTNASAKNAAGKKAKDEDDPLGLNDPAFLPGGEFYHLVNKGDKAKSTKQDGKAAPAARQAFRGGGVRKDAVAVLRARSRGGPSLGFARSQHDSDDDY